MVEGAVVPGVEGGGGIDVEAHDRAGAREEGGEGQHARAGADVEHPAAGDLGVLQQLQGEGGRLVAAGAEGGASREAQESPAGGHLLRHLLRLPRIDEQRPPDGERAGLLPPAGEPVGVRQHLVRRQLHGQRQLDAQISVSFREVRLHPQPPVVARERLHALSAGEPQLAHQGVLQVGGETEGEAAVGHGGEIVSAIGGIGRCGREFHEWRILGVCSSTCEPISSRRQRTPLSTP